MTDGGASRSESTPPLVGPARPIPGVLLAFLTGMFFVNIVSRLILGPLLPIVEEEFRLGHGTAGSLFFFMTVGYCSGLYLSAYAAWRLSHRLTIAVSAMTLGTALIAVSWAPSLSGMRVILVLLGVGSGLYLPSAIAALTENTQEASWGKALAIHELGPNFAYIGAPLLSELLLRFLSWRGVLAAFGTLAILLGAGFLLSRLGEASRAQPPSLATMAPLVRDRAFWGMAGLFLISVGVGLGLYTMMPLFLIHAVGLDRFSANMITGLTRLSALPSVFISGLLADRLGRPRAVAVSLTAAGACALTVALLRGPWITPILIFLQAGSVAAFYPAGYAMLSTVFPAPFRTVAVSMVMILGVLVGAGLVPPAVGFLADHYSFAVAFAAAGLATLASLFLLGSFPSRARPQRLNDAWQPPTAH